MRVDLLFYCRGEDVFTRKMQVLELSLSIYVQNNGDLRVILYCALIQNQKPFSLILNNYAG